MNLRFGPFSVFFTTHFADTYHVLTTVLEQGAFEPLGRRPLDILQDSPAMPTSQEMHKTVGARPMVQANLFLLLDALTHQHLLCARRVFIGKENTTQPTAGPGGLLSRMTARRVVTSEWPAWFAP